MKVYEIREAGSIESVRLAERPEPKPGPRQVVVKIKAAALNFRDLAVARGQYGRGVPVPVIPLSDGAGEVVEVGEGVTRVAVGDRVAGIFMQKWISGTLDETKSRTALGGGVDGMLTEYAALDEEGVVKLPAYLSYEEGATLPCAAVTAWNALVASGGLKAGNTVLVQGTGGVSIFALQIARMSGARVIATSSSDAKLERARQLGASVGINYRSEPDWDKAARAAVEPGVDFVVEVGGAGTLGRSMKAVRMGGTISLIGVLTGGDAEVNPRPLLMKNIRLQGIYVGSREMFEGLLTAMALHQTRPVIDQVFPFADAVAAYRHLESGAHFGKVVIGF